MPTFNGAKYIHQAIESILTQTLQDFEIIVVIDGSTDDTRQKLEQFGNRLVILEQENLGGGAALNTAMSAAQGEYIAILDDDDLAYPQRLSIQVDWLDTHPTAVACSVLFETSSNPGVPTVKPEDICNKEGFVQRPIRKHFDHIFWRPSFTMIRRAAMNGLKFSPIREVPYDREFDLALFAKGDIGIAGNKILGLYRVHEGNVSKTKERGYLGALRLRKLAQSGAFNHFSPAQWDDFAYFMGSRSRYVIIQQLQQGEKGRALEIYCLEWRALLAAKLYLFTLAFPLLILCSPRFSQMRWPVRGALHGKNN